MQLMFFSMLIPYFFCKVFVTSTMKVGRAIFNHVGRYRIIINVRSVLKRNVVHFADASNDSCTLSTFQYLSCFVAHSCLLSIKVRHSCIGFSERIQYCIFGFSKRRRPSASVCEISPEKYLSKVVITLSLATPPMIKS